jgi:peptidoglycan biosynthesis protein MviN/MurJ (putative lipid II flippase)
MIRISHNKSQKNHQSLILLNQEELCVCVCVFVPVDVGGVLFPPGFVMAEFKEAKIGTFTKKNIRIVRNVFLIYIFKIKG